MEFVAGLLLVFISILHIIYGEKKPVADVSRLTKDSILIGSIRVMSLQGGMLLFSVGLIHILSFLKIVTLSGIAAFFPVGIVGLNLATFLLVTLVKHKKLISVAAFQLVLFSAILVLQVITLVRNFR